MPLLLAAMHLATIVASRKLLDPATRKTFNHSCFSRNIQYTLSPLVYRTPPCFERTRSCAPRRFTEVICPAQTLRSQDGLVPQKLAGADL